MRYLLFPWLGIYLQERRDNSILNYSLLRLVRVIRLGEMKVNCCPVIFKVHRCGSSGVSTSYHFETMGHVVWKTTHAWPGYWRTVRQGSHLMICPMCNDAIQYSTSYLYIIYTYHIYPTLPNTLSNTGAQITSIYHIYIYVYMYHTSGIVYQYFRLCWSETSSLLVNCPNPILTKTVSNIHVTMFI